MKKTFKQAIANIEDASRDTDKVLKAARLQRNPDSYMTGEMKYNLAIAVIVLVGVIGFFSIFVLATVLG